MIVFNEQEYSKEACEFFYEILVKIGEKCAKCNIEKRCKGCPLNKLTDEAFAAREALDKRIEKIESGRKENDESVDRKEILEAATRCVCGERERDYGTPERNFELIGELWTTYLKAKCVSPEADVCINGEDVATLMCLFKIARIATGRGKADSFIDLAGYAACAGELATGGGTE